MSFLGWQRQSDRGIVITKVVSFAFPVISLFHLYGLTVDRFYLYPTVLSLLIPSLWDLPDSLRRMTATQPIKAEDVIWQLLFAMVFVLAFFRYRRLVPKVLRGSSFAIVAILLAAYLFASYSFQYFFMAHIESGWYCCFQAGIAFFYLEVGGLLGLGLNDVKSVEADHIQTLRRVKREVADEKEVDC